MRARTTPFLTSLFALSFTVSVVRADEPNGLRFVRTMGERTLPILSNGAGVGAFVRLPQGALPAGVRPLVDGFGTVRGSREEILAFAEKNPGLALEVAPPLHLLMDQSKATTRVDVVRATRGLGGKGVVVGVVDSGIDAAHPDFRFPDGRTRIKWYLDLSERPKGLHPELEAKYKVTGSSGDYGAVLSGDDIDRALTDSRDVPSDSFGHGTHVAGIASAGGPTAYSGMAPEADLVIVHATRANDTIDPEDLVRGADFVMDRAEALGEPAVVNLSLGTDFGPHDGTLAWETALAKLIGPNKPGRAIVAAAGNSGSIAESPVHAGVHAVPGATFRVGMTSSRADDGSITIWVALRPGADLSIGLDGPKGTIVPPVPKGGQYGLNVVTKDENGATIEKYNTGVIYGEGRSQNPVPAGSSGAVVALSGKFLAGQYAVTFEGTGDAELYLQVGGDVRSFAFDAPVREGTINLPATHPDIIGVGCTVSRAHWTSIAGVRVTYGLPLLDPVGGFVLTGDADPHEGDVCWFSSAGPNLLGVPKPEIGAPGGSIVASMSHDAPPSSLGSVFHTDSCPLGGKTFPDRRCLQIDDTHAVLTGTSMSSPMVAGAVALLLQVDPTLTQSEIAMLLQAGAHPFRGASPFEGQAGVGELDVENTLVAHAAYRSGAREGAPVRDKGWVSLSAERARAGRSIPITAIFELRTADGVPASLVPGDLLDADVRIDGEHVDVGRPLRKGPGVFQISFLAPEGSGGRRLRIGASIAGKEVVVPKEVPIATDAWTASYPSTARGGCSAAATPSRASLASVVAGLVVLTGLARRRRHSSSAKR